MSTKYDQEVEAYLRNPLFTHPELMMLAEARNLILDEKNWVKGATHTLIGGLNAYCIQGALEEVQRVTTYESNLDEFLHNKYTQIDRTRAERLLSMACALDGRRYQAVNDSEGHARAVDLLTTAIALGVREYEDGNS